MYSLSAFFILSSTSAVALITPPWKHLDIIKTLDHKKYMVIDKKKSGGNDQPEEDIIKELHQTKFVVEYNRSFI